jgi:hypothetical protein
MVLDIIIGAQMKVLVACEESQRVCSAFRARGHEAYSCDIIDPSGGHPEWHIKSDVLPLLQRKEFQDEFYNIHFGNYFKTMDGILHYVSEWDLIIAHPPCTYLTNTGNRWFNVEKYGDKARERLKLREEAVNFFMAFANADCDHIAIENPIVTMSTRWRKPDQIVQPYFFGDPFEKKTCLWLKGLPLLKKTNEVTPEKRTTYASGKSMPAWYAAAANLPAAERSRIRSQTFPGFAEAMAEQWGKING